MSEAMNETRKKSCFYLLDQDLRNPDITGIDSVPDEIDLLEWIQGCKLPAPTTTLRMQLMNAGGDFRGDIIGSLVTLFSDELKDLLCQLGIDNVDFFPVELVDPKVKDEIEIGYWLVNIIGRFSCVRELEGTFRIDGFGDKDLIGPFEVNKKKTRGKHIFRLDEDPTLIIIDQYLRDQLKTAGVVGVRMRATTSYDGF